MIQNTHTIGTLSVHDRNIIVCSKRLTNHNEDNEKQKRGYCEEI